MPRRLRLLLVAAVIASRLWAFKQFPLCSEDAYITFHTHLSWEWIRASTSPLWALICAPFDPATTARLLAVLADAGAVWAFSAIATPWGSAAFTALWCCPFMLGSAASGLETHMVACLFVCTLRYRWGWLAGALRPDAAVMALVGSWKHWRWAVAGLTGFALLCYVLVGQVIPPTIQAKALVYEPARHFATWYWVWPRELGWMLPALILGASLACLKSRRWPLVLAALVPLVAHSYASSPGFWWYLVPTFGLLLAVSTERLNRVGLLVSVIALGLCWQGQWTPLKERIHQESWLWKQGEKFAALNPSGLVFLEPAGMIPYLNPGLEVIDDVGLTEIQMSQYRHDTDGWYGDAVQTLKPDWIVARTAFVLDPIKNRIGKRKPFRTHIEAQNWWKGRYDPVILPPLSKTDILPDGKKKLVLRYSSMLFVVFKKMPEWK